MYEPTMSGVYRLGLSRVSPQTVYSCYGLPSDTVCNNSISFNADHSQTFPESMYKKTKGNPHKGNPHKTGILSAHVCLSPFFARAVIALLATWTLYRFLGSSHRVATLSGRSSPLASLLLQAELAQSGGILRDAAHAEAERGVRVERQATRDTAGDGRQQGEAGGFPFSLRQN